LDRLSGMCCRVMILRQDASAWQNLTSLAVMSIMIHCSIRVLPTGFREGEAMPKTRTGLRASHVVAIGVIVVGLLVYNLHPTFSGAQNPAQQAPGGRPTAVWPNVKPTASSSEDTVRFEATWATTEGIVTSVKIPVPDWHSICAGEVAKQERPQSVEIGPEAL
jgi:hypothetical protein